MKIEVKKGVLARKLGKDFKDEGFVPLNVGTYEVSGPAEAGQYSSIPASRVDLVDHLQHGVLPVALRGA